MNKNKKLFFTVSLMLLSAYYITHPFEPMQTDDDEIVTIETSDAQIKVPLNIALEFDTIYDLLKNNTQERLHKTISFRDIRGKQLRTLMKIGEQNLPSIHGNVMEFHGMEPIYKTLKSHNEQHPVRLLKAANFLGAPGEIQKGILKYLIEKRFTFISNKFEQGVDPLQIAQSMGIPIDLQELFARYVLNAHLKKGTEKWNREQRAQEIEEYVERITPWMLFKAMVLGIPLDQQMSIPGDFD